MGRLSDALKARVASGTPLFTAQQAKTMTTPAMPKPAPAAASGAIPKPATPTMVGAAAGISAGRTTAAPTAAPKPAMPQVAPTYNEAAQTNYGGSGSALNEILYSKKQYDAGNKAWAANNAQQFYAKLDPAEAAAVKGMNTQQLIDYINSKNKPAAAPAPSVPQGYSNAGTTGVAPQPSTYTPQYTGPDMSGMQKQINDIFAGRQASELQKLREARDVAQQGYNSQEAAANRSAYDARNQADTVNLQNAQAMRETMANQGLNTDGQNLTLQAAQNAQRLGALNDINVQNAAALQDISQKRALLNDNAAKNELALTQEINSDRASALYDLMKYGDTRAFDVEKYNYGRYRDDVNQQFAQDQFDWGKQMDTADRLGLLNGQQTLAGRSQALNERNANLNAALAYSDLTGRVLTPQSDWSGYARQAASGNAPLSMAGQGQQFNQDMAQQQFVYQKARDSIQDKQWKAQFDQDVRQFGLNYALQKNAQALSAANQSADNALGWANLNQRKNEFNYGQQQDAREWAWKTDPNNPDNMPKGNEPSTKQLESSYVSKLNTLTPDQVKDVFQSQQAAIINDLGIEGYNRLYNQYFDQYGMPKQK